MKVYGLWWPQLKNASITKADQCGTLFNNKLKKVLMFTDVANTLLA